LMRQAGLLAPSRAQRVLGPQVHDGTIITDRPNQMWGTDATSTVTLEEGPVTVFVAIDHCTLEGVGIHAATTATRFEALEPIRQGVRRQFVLGSKKWTPSTYNERAGGVKWNRFRDSSRRRNSGSRPCGWSWNSR
jgi:hypothetical protein